MGSVCSSTKRNNGKNKFQLCRWKQKVNDELTLSESLCSLETSVVSELEVSQRVSHLLVHAHELAQLPGVFIIGPEVVLCAGHGLRE